MIEVARVRHESTAAPELFVQRWADVESHPEWAPSMEYFRLHEPFAIGARGVSKPRAGAEQEFEVTAYQPGRVYADTTYLDGAALTVHHEAERVGQTTVLTVYATLDGPLAVEWATRMGDDVHTGIAGDVASLVALVESEQEA